MSEIRTIHVDNNKRRQQEEARQKAEYERRRREAALRRKRKQTLKYVVSFTLMLSAIGLCCAYLFGFFDSADKDSDNKQNPTTSLNVVDENPTEEPTTEVVPVVGFDASEYNFTAEMYKFEIEDKIHDMVIKAANTEGENQDIYKFLLDNKAAYPQGLLYLAVNEPAALEFVINYPFESKDASLYFDLSDDVKEGEVPSLIQWDKRWGYAEYGDDCMALDGCGPTCLSMVLIGLTGNTIYNPMYVGNYCEKLGYYLENVGTMWSFFTEGAEYFNVDSQQISNNEEAMVGEIEQGHILICSMAPGDFTMSGHFIVIHDYVDGEFVVNDPNSISRSEKTWSYERIKEQIKAVWTFKMKDTE